MHYAFLVVVLFLLFVKFIAYSSGHRSFWSYGRKGKLLNLSSISLVLVHSPFSHPTAVLTPVGWTWMITEPIKKEMEHSHLASVTVKWLKG